MKKIFEKIKDYIVGRPILSKALHTFYQAFIGVFVVGFTAVLNSVLNGDIETAKIAILSLLSASLAAGISALKTFILQKIK
jgi:hypothetical protein